MKTEIMDLSPAEQEDFEDYLTTMLLVCDFTLEEAAEAAYTMIQRRRDGIEDRIII